VTFAAEEGDRKRI